MENKNVALFLNKTVKDNLLQMIEGDTAFDTYKELFKMAPDKSNIIRSLLAKVLIVGSIDVQEYVLEHQDIHSSLMKANPQGTTEASTHLAHMTRLLDDLSQDQQLTMNYLLFS